MTENEGRNYVMGLVVAKLYFGWRPSQTEMLKNASVLKRLRKRYDWDTLAQVVEGLGLRRDRGELGKIRPTDPVSLLWLVDKSQTVNQVALCQDAYYRLQKPTTKGITLMADIMAQLGRKNAG